MTVRWLSVFVGLIITTITALSVHAFMLQGLHVPYPYSYPHQGWPVFPDAFVLTVAALYLLPMLDERFQELPLGHRCLMLFVLLATIKESLFRAAFMDIMNSNSIIYPVVQAIPKLLTLAITAACVVLSATRTKKQWNKWIGALVISAFVFFLCQPLIERFFNRLLASIAWMSGPSLYNPPYDYHILIPAYLSFLEPAIASFFMVALVWRRLPAGSMLRVGAFTLLVLGLKGPVLKPFINIHFANTGAVTALLSEGQFTFESIALGALTALTWAAASKNDRKTLAEV